MNATFVAIGIVHSLATACKCMTIIKHLLWIVENGEAFRKSLSKLRKKSRRGILICATDMYQVLSKRRYTKRWVPAMGIQEYRAKSAMQKLKKVNGVRSLFASIAIRLVVILYDFATLGFLGGLLLIWMGTNIDEEVSHAAMARSIGLIVAIILLTTSYVLTIEPAVVYFYLGSYAKAFQSPLSYVNDRKPPNFMNELKILISLVGALIYIHACIVSFLINAGYESFSYPPLKNVQGLFHCVYAVVLIFLNDSPLAPVTNLGQFFYISIVIQGVFVIAIPLVALFAIARFPRLHKK